MSKKKIGLISLSVVIFIIVVISMPSRSNMVDMNQINEYAETLKEPVKEKEKSLVVMVSPSINEEYYEEVFSEIIEYDINAVNTIYGKDNIVLLVDQDTKHLFEGKIPDEVIHVSNVADIWIRDFGTVDTLTEVKFDYKPQYLENEDSEWIDDSFRDWFVTKSLSSQTSDLILDGGNLVFNGDNKAVTTVSFFRQSSIF